MALFIPNGTYWIENVGKSGDKKFLTVQSVNNENVIVVDVKDDKKPQKWVLRDQGNYGGPELQLVSLQLSGSGADHLGFFHVEKPTDGREVKYNKLASIVKLEDISDDHVSIRFTKGSNNLALIAPAPAEETKVKLANRDPANGRQQWRFIKV